MLPIGVDVVEESPYETIEEAANMVAQSSSTVTSMDYEMDDAMPITSSSTLTESQSSNQFIGHAIPKDFLIKSGLLNSSTDESDSTEPLYAVNKDGSVKGKDSVTTKMKIQNSRNYFVICLQIPLKKSTMH